MSLKKIKFTKMHGTGNDYVYVNCFEYKIDDPCKLSEIVSPRRKSIGSDGLILICPSDIADARMRMFNSDGSEGKMCGNGIRCVGKYLYDNGIVKKQNMTIETESGIKTLWLTVNEGEADFVRVDMGIPETVPEKIPVIFGGHDMTDAPVSIAGNTYRITAVSMGNPHAVIFCDNTNNIDLEKIGPQIENDPMFPEKTNVEFIKILSPTEIEMRVWERGSGETFSCGTGACGSVAASVINGFCKRGDEITIHLKGGELYITYAEDSHIYMRGEAVKVFDGEFQYES